VPLAKLLPAAALAAAALAAAAPARAPTHAPVLAASGASDTAVFAGGCFWGVEAVFEHVRGVTSVVSGMAAGDTRSPARAEAVQVVFDPAQLSYAQLLDVFFGVAHDPTQRDRQGPDIGPQYRSVVFARTPEQRRAAGAHVERLTRTRVWPKPIATEVASLARFHVAGPEHQDYVARNPGEPYVVINDAPKLRHLRQRFPTLYRDAATAGR
jgi:peptide-methionine (S)-S-oxide reductase